MFGSALDIEHAFADTALVTTRTRVRRRRLAALLISVGLVGLVSAQVANAMGVHGEQAGSPRTYVVRPGDTLWAIAVELAPGRDPRPTVDAIAASNGLDPGSLVPGQRITIPAA
jgi:LysM repeat protein